MTNEKGEVIAKWLGFKLSPDESWWIDPLGWFVALPDFTDLTTLFKWCVPVVRQRYGDAITYNLLRDWVHGAYLVNVIPTGEALRDAILALIESEKEVG